MIELLSTMRSVLCWRIIGEGVNVSVDWWIRSMTCGRLRLERPVRWHQIMGSGETESVFEMFEGRRTDAILRP